APLYLDHRYIPGGQYMLGLAGLSLGEHRGMLQQPDLIRGVGIALGSELPHGFQRGLVVHQPQMRSEEHTSELQSRENLVCRLLAAFASFSRSLHDALPISPRSTWITGISPAASTCSALPACPWVNTGGCCSSQI